MVRFCFNFAALSVFALATANWWLPAAISLCRLLVTNYDLIRQTIG